jgi:hypothetical protein
MCIAGRRRAVSLAGIWRSPGLHLSRGDSDLLDSVAGAPHLKRDSVAARGKLLGVGGEVVNPAITLERCTRHIEGAVRKSRACHEMGAK